MSDARRKNTAIAERPTATADTSYSVPAVDKALDILELLADSSEGMSLTGIAEALGRTKQELFRVLICLQQRGYLVRDEAQFYRLSTRLFEIGSQHASTQFLIAHAMPHMERLARQLGESCHLNIVTQNRMLVVARAEGNADVLVAVRIGANFELHRRMSGLVAMAMLADGRRRDYWKQSGESAATVSASEERIAAVRTRGFAHEDSPLVMGVKDCAAPVLGSNHGPGSASLLGVLCVSHLCRRDDPDEHTEIVQAVLECTRRISAEFGPVSQA